MKKRILYFFYFIPILSISAQGVFDNTHGEVLNSAFKNNKNAFQNNSTNFSKVFKYKIETTTVTTTEVWYYYLQKCSGFKKSDNSCSDPIYEYTKYNGTLIDCQKITYGNSGIYCEERTKTQKKYSTNPNKIKILKSGFIDVNLEVPAGGCSMNHSVKYNNSNIHTLKDPLESKWLKSKSNSFTKTLSFGDVYKIGNGNSISKIHYFASARGGTEKMERSGQTVSIDITESYYETRNTNCPKFGIDHWINETHFKYTPHYSDYIPYLSKATVVTKKSTNSSTGIDANIPNIDNHQNGFKSISFTGASNTSWNWGVCPKSKKDSYCKTSDGGRSRTLTLNKSTIKSKALGLKKQFFYLYAEQTGSFNRRWVKIEMDIYPEFETISKTHFLNIEGTQNYLFGFKYDLKNYAYNSNRKLEFTVVDGKANPVVIPNINTVNKTTASSEQSLYFSVQSTKPVLNPILRLSKFYLKTNQSNFFNPFGNLSNNSANDQKTWTLIGYSQDNKTNVNKSTITPTLTDNFTVQKPYFSTYQTVSDTVIYPVISYQRNYIRGDNCNNCGVKKEEWLDKTANTIKQAQPDVLDFETNKTLYHFPEFKDTYRLTLGDKSIQKTLTLEAKSISPQDLKNSKQILYAPVKFEWVQPEIKSRYGHQSGKMRILAEADFNLPNSEGHRLVVLYPDALGSWGKKIIPPTQNSFEATSFEYQYQEDKTTIYYLVVKQVDADKSASDLINSNSLFGDRLTVPEPMEVTHTGYEELGNPIDKGYRPRIDLTDSHFNWTKKFQVEDDQMRTFADTVPNQTVDKNISFYVNPDITDTKMREVWDVENFNGVELKWENAPYKVSPQTDTVVYGYQKMLITSSPQDSVTHYGGADGRLTIQLKNGRPPYEFRLDSAEKTIRVDTVRDLNYIFTGLFANQYQDQRMPPQHNNSAWALKPDFDLEYRVSVRDVFGIYFDGFEGSSYETKLDSVYQPDTLRVRHYGNFQDEDEYTTKTENLWWHEPRGYKKSDGYIALKIEGGFQSYTYQFYRNGVLQNPIPWKFGSFNTLDTIFGLDSATYRLTVKDRFGNAPMVDDTVHMIHPDTFEIYDNYTIRACSPTTRGKHQLRVRGGRKFKPLSEKTEKSRFYYHYDIGKLSTFSVPGLGEIEGWGYNELLPAKRIDSIVADGISNGGIPLGKYRIRVTDVYGNQVYGEYEMKVVEQPLRWNSSWVAHQTRKAKADGFIIPKVAGGRDQILFHLVSSQGDKISYTEAPFETDLPKGFYGLKNQQGLSYVLSATDQKGLGCSIDTTISIYEPYREQDSKIIEQVKAKRWNATNGWFSVQTWDGWRKKAGKTGIYVEGNLPNYTYQWSRRDLNKKGILGVEGIGVFVPMVGETDSIIQNLGAGEYKVAIINPADTFNRPHHRLTHSFVLQEPDTFRLVFNGGKKRHDTVAYGWKDGEMNYQIQGGWTPYDQERWTFRAPNTLSQTPLPTESKLTLTFQGGQLTNLPPGTYTVEASYPFIFPENRTEIIKTMDTFNVLEADSMWVELLQITPVSRYGATDGGIKVQLHGGVKPYTYQWIDTDWGGSGMEILDYKGLSKGTHQLCFDDKINQKPEDCEVIFSHYLPQPDSLKANLQLIEPLEFGETGTLSAEPSGGNPPYFYQWKNKNGTLLGTDSELKGKKGIYQLRIEDKVYRETNGIRGAHLSLDTLLNEPAKFEVQIQNHRPKVCAATPEIELEAIASGGFLQPNSDYQYQWFIQTKEDNTYQPIDYAQHPKLSNNRYGNFKVRVTDDHQILREAFAQVSVGDTLKVTPTVSPISCFSTHDGSIDLTITGGEAPYRVIWRDIAERLNSRNNLTAGRYHFQVLDNLDCGISDSIDLKAPNGLLPDLQVQQPTCHTCLGSAKMTISGGNSNYQYAWTNELGQSYGTKSSVENLPSGIYQVKLTLGDGGNCEVLARSFTIQQPKEFNLTLTSNRPKVCYGGQDGEFSSQVTGGTVFSDKKDYDYQWMDASGKIIGRDPNLTGLAVGQYTLKVQDKHSNTLTQKVKITQAPKLILDSVALVTVDCKGSNTGSMEVFASGGTLPYTYLWNSGETTPKISKKPASTYEVAIRDALGCEIKYKSPISEPDLPLTTDIYASNTSCYGECNGLVRLSPQGGTAPYSYQWLSDQITSNERNDLCQGVYTVAVTDSRGCEITKKININSPVEPILTLSQNKNLCQGQKMTLTSHLENAKAKTYRWFRNDQMVGQESNLTIGKGGNYRLAIETDQFCQLSDSLQITDIAKEFKAGLIAPGKIYTQREFSIINLSYPNIDLSQWLIKNDPAVEIISQSAVQLTLKIKETGDYSFGVYHENLPCYDSVYTKITALENPYINQFGIDTAQTKFSPEFKQFSIYPNPVKDFLTLDIQTKEAKHLNAMLVNVGTGKMVLNQVVSMVNKTSTLPMNRIPKGTYILVVIAGKHMQTQTILKLD